MTRYSCSDKYLLVCLVGGDEDAVLDARLQRPVPVGADRLAAAQREVLGQVRDLSGNPAPRVRVVFQL